MSKVIKKTIRISEEANEVIKEIVNAAGFKTEASAIEYIIRNYGNKEKRAKEESLRTIQHALKSVEEHTQVTLDLINTFMYVYDPQDNGMYECISSSDMPHPFLEQSRNTYKEKIAAKKQIKDNLKRKRGE